MNVLVAAWAGGRAVYAVGDSAYARQALPGRRPATVHVISRLRLDAALWTRPRRRLPGQTGRPRKRGTRVPAPQALAATWRRWRLLPVTLYGRAVTPQVFALTALWYAALPEHPVRIVVVRDPTGRRQDEAFFCTDTGAAEAFILEGYARRWTLEVTFHESKQWLGLADPQTQVARAVRRTAPFASSSTTWSCCGTPSAPAPARPPTGCTAPGTATRRPLPSRTCSPPSDSRAGAGTFLRRRTPHSGRKTRRFPGPMQCWPPRNGGSRG